MNELAFSDIDANVAEGAAQGVEKHQVARLQFGFIDFFSGLRLRLGVVRQNQTQGVFIHGLYKATAVKALDARAATAIGHTQVAHGVDHQVRGLRADVLADCAYLLTNIHHGLDHAALNQQQVEVVMRGVVGCGMGPQSAKH